jgi:WD40 repeat protein
VLLSLAAVERGEAAGGGALGEARNALHRAVGASRIRLRVPGLGGALDWSPDGTLFVTEGPEDSGRIDVRDARTGESVRTFPAHDPDVNLVAFSPDGARLATTGDDGTLKLWEPRSGRQLRTFTGRGPVWGAAFSPDGTRVAASWWEESAVRVFDVATGRRVAEIPAETVSLGMSFSPDGRRLAIPTFDSGALVVDLHDGDVEQRLRGQEGLTDAEWSPDGRWIATSSLDASVWIRDARTGRDRRRLTTHRSAVVAVDWSADSRSLATGSEDGTAKVWSVDRGRPDEVVTIEVQEQGGGVWVAFSPDGRRLMTGDQHITAVKVWDVQPGGGAEWPVLPAPAGAGGAVEFTPDGSAIAVGGADGALTLWDPRTGELTGTTAPGGEMAGGPVGALARGDELAALTGSGVRVWDATGRRERFDLPVPEGVDLAWSADGSVLAVARPDGVLLVDRTGATLGRLAGDPVRRSTAVAVSPDGRFVASALTEAGYPQTPDGEVVIRDRRSGARVAKLASSATSLAFSHDGKRIATAPIIGPVRLWDARSGRLETTLTGYAGAVTDVAFSPGDTALATGSADGRVRVWDPETGRRQLELRGHVGVVRDLAFSPDGKQLASSGAEGVVRVWALDDDDLAAIARSRLTRGLTAAECRRYLGDGGCS